MYDLYRQGWWVWHRRFRKYLECLYKYTQTRVFTVSRLVTVYNWMVSLSAYSGGSLPFCVQLQLWTHPKSHCSNRCFLAQENPLCENPCVSYCFKHVKGLFQKHWEVNLSWNREVSWPFKRRECLARWCSWNETIDPYGAIHTGGEHSQQDKASLFFFVQRIDFFFLPLCNESGRPIRFEL